MARTTPRLFVLCREDESGIQLVMGVFSSLDQAQEFARTTAVTHLTWSAASDTGFNAPWYAYLNDDTTYLIYERALNCGVREE